MYTGFLHTHNLLRYIILILFVVNLIFIWKGYLKKEEWTSNLDRVLKYLAVSLDAQLVIGLVLYVFLSPLMRTVFNNFGAAMKDSSLRFFAVEHITAMIISIALVHIGKSKIKKAENGKKYKLAAIYLTIAFVILVAAIPWPFYTFGKPLF